MSNDKVRVAYGSVVNVKAIPTRDVTRIEIELPIESHAELTRLLFGRQALVLPGNLPASVNYGVMDSPNGQTSSSGEAIRADALAKPSSSFSRLVTHRHPAGHAPAATTTTMTRTGTVTRGAAPLDIVKWLGMRCGDSNFQEFMKALTSEDAAQAVRNVCGVASRSEIPANATARALFYQQIYHPYQRHLALVAGRLHGFEP